MKMIIQFDCDADIIEVPAWVVENREILRRRFWKWLSNKSVKHGYWRTFTDCSGKQLVGLQYRGDAFVEWLNKKVLKDSEEKAVLLEQHIWDESQELPSIFF